MVKEKSNEFKKISKGRKAEYLFKDNILDSDIISKKRDLINKSVNQLLKNNELDNEILDSIKKLHQENRSKLSKKEKNKLDKKILTNNIYYKNKELIIRETIGLFVLGADVNARDKRGWTPLMVAAANGQTEKVRVLIQLGADVNAKDPYGINALMYASEAGFIEVVKLLLQSGADVNAKDNLNGWDAIDYAEKNAHKEIVEIIKAHKIK